MITPEPAVRLLDASDVADYKTIRLEALTREPGSYASNAARESALTDDDWRARLGRPGSATFGVYAGGQIVGVTGIFVNGSDSEQGILVQSYLRPEWRGQGYSRSLYEARIAWARQNGLRRIVVSHRADNLASRGAMLRAGFQPTHVEPYTWPDGVEIDQCHYVLHL